MPYRPLEGAGVPARLPRLQGQCGLIPNAGSKPIPQALKGAEVIISHAHRFVFIKTRKTAGTSIEIELSKRCGPDDIITPILPKDEILRGACGGRVAQNFTNNKALVDAYRKAALSGNRSELRRLFLQIRPEDYYNHIPVSKVKERCGPLGDYFWFTHLVSSYLSQNSEHKIPFYLRKEDNNDLLSLCNLILEYRFPFYASFLFTFD